MPDVVAAHVPTRIAPPPAGWNGTVQSGGVDADKKATQSLAFGIASFLINPFLLCTIIAITYGVKSLRANTAHRGRAIAGIVLGVSGLLIVIAAVVIVPPVLQAVSRAATQHALESRITADMAKDGVVLTDVVCPTFTSTAQGSSITCTGQQAGAGAGTISLEVRFIDAKGDYTLQSSSAV